MSILEDPSPGEGPLTVGLGMSILDHLIEVEEFPRRTGLTASQGSALMGGGPVATALCAAASLGARVTMLDRLADDWRGDLLRVEYLIRGVGSEHLKVHPGGRSSMATVMVRRRDGERHIIYEVGDCPPLSSEDLPESVLRQAAWLHVNGRHLSACLSAARHVRSGGGRVSFDGGANRYEKATEALYPWVDVLVVARDYAERLSESLDRHQQLQHLARWGAELVGITDGVHGSWFATSAGDLFHQKAFTAGPVRDTTGCGDVFHGALLFARQRGDDWRTCARFASAAAAWAATALGGRGYLPRVTEVEELMAEAL